MNSFLFYKLMIIEKKTSFYLQMPLKYFLYLTLFQVFSYWQNSFVELLRRTCKCMAITTKYGNDVSWPWKSIWRNKLHYNCHFVYTYIWVFCYLPGVVVVEIFVLVETHRPLHKLYNSLLYQRPPPTRTGEALRPTPTQPTDEQTALSAHSC